MSFEDIVPRPVKTYHAKPYDRIDPSSAKFSGKGKTALITGGATGVGRAIATSFAQTGISRIIIVSRSPGPQARAKADLTASFPHLEVVTIQAAMTDAARMEEVIRTVGDIDVLVLSAAWTHNHTATLKIPIADVAETFATNIMGNFNVARPYLAAPAPASGAKTILNISSGAAHFILPGQVGYGPSKCGFAQVIQQLAAEFTPAKDNIRMFNVHPGAFYTEMVQTLGYPKESAAWEDVALAGNFAVWLAGSESDFLHGKFVWAQWDVDELIALKERIEKEPSFLTIGLVM